MPNKRSDDPFFAPMRIAREIVARQIEAVWAIKNISRDDREKAVRALEGLPIYEMAKIVDKAYTKPVGSGPDEQTPLADSIKKVISPDRPSSVPRSSKKKNT